MDTEQLLGVMAEHVRHTADIGGVEVCALGGDMDGIDPKSGHSGCVLCSAAGTCTEKGRLP